MPLPSSRSSHSCVVFCFVSLSIRPSSSTRFATRTLFVAYRSSVTHSGLPSFWHRIPNNRSLPPPMSRSPSDVLKPLYGTIEATRISSVLHDYCDARVDSRCAVPHRPVSFLPVTRTELAMFVKLAVCVSLNDTSMCCPLLFFDRPIRAAMMELLVYSPVVRSVMATPTFTGGPSREPVMCMRPNSLRLCQHLTVRSPSCYSRFYHNIVACSIAVRPILSIARDARIDELRIEFVQRLEVHAILLE